MKALIAIVSILLLTGCLNSSYHYSSSGSSSNPKQRVKSRVKYISIGFVSTLPFRKAWYQSYFRDSLKEALSELSDIKVVRGGTNYSVSVDLRDMSLKGKQKMGKFLGQKQYRIVQIFNVHARYRIEKRGARTILKQGDVYYTPYADTASNISYEDARQKVVKKKLKGITKRVAIEVVKYFDSNSR